MNPRQHGFSELFSNRSFLALWLGQCFSQGADRFIFILLVEILAHLHGSPRVLSLTLAVYAAPNIILGAPAGVLADRFDKRKILVLSNLARAGLVLVLGTLGQLTLGMPATIAFMMACAAQPFVPAEAAAIPLVVAREQLMQANAIASLTMIGSLVLGFVAGEPLIHRFGIDGASAVVAVAFVLSAACLSAIGNLSGEHPVAPDDSFWAQMRQGFQYINRRGGIRRTIAMQVTIFSTFAALSVVAIVYAKTVLQTNFSWFLAVGGLGMTIGTWAIGHWGSRLNRDVTIALGFFANGLILFGLAAVGKEQCSLAYGLATLLGFASAIVGVPLQTRLQELVDDGVRGKVFGVQNTALNAVAIVPLGLSGFVVERWGVPAVFCGLATMLCLAGVGAWHSRLGPGERDLKA